MINGVILITNQPSHRHHHMRTFGAIRIAEDALLIGGGPHGWI